MSDKERIAELADAFNKVCDENADFVAQSVTDENRIAQLEAQVEHCEGHAAELEAEVMAWRERFALAVAALKDIRTADDDCVCDSGYSANTVAIETIAQIEEGK